MYFGVIDSLLELLSWHFKSIFEFLKMYASYFFSQTSLVLLSSVIADPWDNWWKQISTFRVDGMTDPFGFLQEQCSGQQGQRGKPQVDCRWHVGCLWQFSMAAVTDAVGVGVSRSALGMSANLCLLLEKALRVSSVQMKNHTFILYSLCCTP